MELIDDLDFTIGFLTSDDENSNITMRMVKTSQKGIGIFLFTCQANLTTPDGRKVELNRYFKEVDGQMVQIEKAEFDERKDKRVDKK